MKLGDWLLVFCYNFPVLKSIFQNKSCIIFFIIMSGFPVFSETIILKNREIIAGKVVSQDKNRLVLKLANGMTRVLQKKQISKITYKSLEVVKQELKTEEKKSESALEAEKKQAIIEKPDENSGPVPAMLTESQTVIPEVLVESKISPNKAFLYSALLPGPGQYKQNRKKISAWHWSTRSFLY